MENTIGILQIEAMVFNNQFNTVMHNLKLCEKEYARRVNQNEAEFSIQSAARNVDLCNRKYNDLIRHL